jgi:hypothetical protein
VALGFNCCLFILFICKLCLLFIARRGESDVLVRRWDCHGTPCNQPHDRESQRRQHSNVITAESQRRGPHFFGCRPLATQASLMRIQRCRNYHGEAVTCARANQGFGPSIHAPYDFNIQHRAEGAWGILEFSLLSHQSFYCPGSSLDASSRTKVLRE